MQPALAVDHRRRRLRIAQIALHHVEAARHQFAFLARREEGAVWPHRRELHAVDRAAGGFDHHVVRILAADHRDRAAALGQAVAGIDHLGAQLGADRLDHRRVDRRAAGADDAQRGQPRRLLGGRAQQRLEKRRRPGQEGDLFGHRALDQLIDVHGRFGEDRRAGEDAG